MNTAKQKHTTYSTQKGIRLNRGNHINGSHPLSKHAFVIGNTTKVYRRT